jgi:hypothetical protein
MKNHKTELQLIATAATVLSTSATSATSASGSNTRLEHSARHADRMLPICNKLKPSKTTPKETPGHV